MQRQQPLIEHIEGQEADNRAALWSAWVRINASARPSNTNLHVRELLMLVFAQDRTGRGVKMTYDEIAMRLECNRTAARRIVFRAQHEYGMLAVIEDRYADGGQTANRYSIDWPVVRSINVGQITRPNRYGEFRPGAQYEHPPAQYEQGAVHIEQAPAQCEHPYKDTPEFNSRIQLQNSTTTTRLESAAPNPESAIDEQRASSGVDGNGGREAWDVVVVGLKSRGVGDVQGAVQAAKSRNLTVADCIALLEGYDREGVSSPARLHRLMTGRAQLEPALPGGVASGIRSSHRERPTMRSLGLL